MIPTDDLNDFALPDGGRIIADISPRSGIQVRRFNAASDELARVELAYPSAGFAAGGWLLSPSGKLLVLHYYSGQSEETFALLDMSLNGLKLVANPEYVYGEYASYAFSPTEDDLVFALPQDSVAWWTVWEDEGLEMADDGTSVVSFATLLLCSTDTGRIHRTEVELVPMVPQPLQTEDYDPDLDPQLSAAHLVSLQLPWGRVSLDLLGEPSRVRVPYPS